MSVRAASSVTRNTRRRAASSGAAVAMLLVVVATTTAPRPARCAGTGRRARGCQARQRRPPGGVGPAVEGGSGAAAMVASGALLPLPFPFLVPFCFLVWLERCNTSVPSHIYYVYMYMSNVHV